MVSENSGQKCDHVAGPVSLPAPKSIFSSTHLQLVGLWDLPCQRLVGVNDVGFIVMNSLAMIVGIGIKTPFDSFAQSTIDLRTDTKKPAPNLKLNAGFSNGGGEGS